MVRITMSALFCLLSIQVSIINAEPVFTTAISTDTIQLGKSFSLTLSTNSSAKNLNAIDLGTLKKTFYINPTSDITFDESTGYYNRKLRLIAYQTGITHIPELKFNGQTSKPHIITVIHPIDDKTHTPIQLQANVSNYQPWLREQTLVTYNITTHFARAQIKTIPLNQPNVLTQELEVIRNQSNLQSTYRYKTGWAVFPVITGKLEISLPPIELVRDGVTTHQFYHPPISLDVKPLPLYVPATIPVGNVTFTNRSQFNYLKTNKLATHKVALSGHGLLLNFLPNISHQIRSNDSVKIYPENTDSIQHNHSDGISSTINYSIPLKSIKQGYTRLDDIKITYFDTSQNRLVTKSYPSIKIFSLNTWLHWLIFLAITLLLLFIFKTIFNWVFRKIRAIQRYHRALTILNTNCTPDDIKSIIQLLADAQGYPINTTPLAWYTNLPDKLVKNNQELIDSIHNYLYKTQRKKADPTILIGLRNIIFNAQPILRWF